MKSINRIVLVWMTTMCLVVLSCDEELDPFPVPQCPELCLNEFMARNDSTVVDEFGEADDWVEIYNKVEFEGDLVGYYLTDDLDEPAKWPLPDTHIAAQGFLIVWTDDDPEQGAMHASFKLSGSGEFLGLYCDTDSEFVAIDSLTFPQQYPDTSYARTTDGDGDWFYQDKPTPGISNLLTLWSIPR